MIAKANADDKILSHKLEEENDIDKMHYEDPHPLLIFLSRKNISVDEFAKHVGYSPAYFAMVLSRWKRPGARLAIEIENLTGMSTSYLLRVPLKNEYAKK